MTTRVNKFENTAKITINQRIDVNIKHNYLIYDPQSPLTLNID